MTTIVINPTQRSALAESFNEKTSLTWLWSLLFGPLWFLVNGFIGWGLALFGLGVVIAVFGAVEPAFYLLQVVIWLIAPFAAYSAHKARAEKKADDALKQAAILNAA